MDGMSIVPIGLTGRKGGDLSTMPSTVARLAAGRGRDCTASPPGQTRNDRRRIRFPADRSVGRSFLTIRWLVTHEYTHPRVVQWIGFHSVRFDRTREVSGNSPLQYSTVRNRFRPT